MEAEFVGGPADGVVRDFEGSEPPKLTKVYTYPEGTFTYKRQVSQLDQGPLWVYVPEDAPDGPR